MNIFDPNDEIIAVLGHNDNKYAININGKTKSSNINDLKKYLGKFKNNDEYSVGYIKV